jgi:HK97 family phage prohead protease
MEVINTNMNEKILKSISEIKDVDSHGIIKGYANVYNIKDSDGDISMPGSFTKTITERGDKIRIFKNHTPELVGVPLEFDTTDSYGLLTTIKMNLNTQVGKDTFNDVKFLIENGKKSGMSIGGFVMKRGAQNKSEVLEYRLHEISVLTTVDPANGLSLIDVVKSVKELSEPTREEFWMLIEKAYNDRFSDNVLKSLEKFLSLNQEPERNATTPEVEPTKIITEIYKLFI